MNRQWLKYLLILCLLITYINRGLFVSIPEAESTSKSISGQIEINSMIEFLHWVINGHENGIDEDGNSPESYNFAKLAQSLIDPGQIHTMELHQPFIRIQKIAFPVVELLFFPSLYGTIDHPPEKM